MTDMDYAPAIDTHREYLEKVVNSHWAYIEGILDSGILDDREHNREEVMRMLKYQYISAFKHGFKHGVEMEKVTLTQLPKKSDIATAIAFIDRLSE